MRTMKLLLPLVLILILTGCGGRDISSVRTSIIGHWSETSEDGKQDIYIGNDKFITIINDTKMIYDYKVVAENDKRKEIILTTEDAEGSGLKYQLKFKSKEMTDIICTIDIFDIKNPDKGEQDALDLIETLAPALGVDTEQTEGWEYVDDNIEP